MDAYLSELLCDPDSANALNLVIPGLNYVPDSMRHQPLRQILKELAGLSDEQISGIEKMLAD